MSSYSYSPYYAPYPSPSGRYSPYSSLYPPAPGSTTGAPTQPLPLRTGSAPAFGSQDHLRLPLPPSPALVPSSTSPPASGSSQYLRSIGGGPPPHRTAPQPILAPPRRGSTSSTSLSPQTRSPLSSSPSHPYSGSLAYGQYQSPRSRLGSERSWWESDGAGAAPSSKPADPLDDPSEYTGSGFSEGIVLANPGERKPLATLARLPRIPRLTPQSDSSLTLSDEKPDPLSAYDHISAEKDRLRRQSYSGVNEKLGLYVSGQQHRDSHVARAADQDVDDDETGDDAYDYARRRRQRTRSNSESCENDPYQMSPSRASTPTPRSVAQRAASFNGSGRDATDARTANQANGGKPEQPSTVHRAGFSAASFILLTTLPIISAWSHSLRIHFGPYPALAITIAASAVLGCLLADRRHQLASMYASLRAHPAGKEAAALIGVLGAAYVACAFMPLAFRLLHGIMNGLPLVGGVAVYAVLLWGTTVLGVATVWTMAVMSWDVTRVVHGAVVKVSRYVVAPDATADASAPPPPVEMQTRSRGGGLGGGRYHHQHHHHHQRHVVGGGFRVVNSSDSSEDSSDHEEDDDDDGGQGVEAAFEALRTTTNRTTTTKTNSTATFVGSDGKFKATLGETSQRQQQRESSMYLGKGKMPSFYDDDGGGGFRGSVPRPAEDDRRSMVGF